MGTVEFGDRSPHWGPGAEQSPSEEWGTGYGNYGPGKNGPGKNGPAKTVQVITVLGKNGPGKKGPAYNQPTNEQFCCLLKILEGN